MKLIFRCLMIIVTSIFSLNAFAVDHITCSLTSSGIPGSTQPGTTYTNTYTCNNTYPSSFPGVQLVGSVKGDTAGTSVGGSCTGGKLNSGQSCQFALNLTPSSAGSRSFNLHVAIGTLYAINLPTVTTTTTSQAVITWPGRTSGSATVDTNGDGSGAFTANATDSSGHAITYTFALSGAGSVVAGSTVGTFTITGATDTNETVTVTATADDASPVVGDPIAITQYDVITKKIVIYNNSNEAIYPIIEAPILSVSDPWLQAYFQDSNISTHKYIQTKVHRIYVNPTTGGVPAGGSVSITVPFYSQLTANPNPASPDQYIDWWNAMRVYIYDDASILQTRYNADTSTPVTPVTPGLTCDPGSTCEPLTIYSNTVGLPLYDPSQLTEYTFANVVTSQGTPFPIDTNYVDYDISYVDHVYLPVAMEPYGNSEVGYSGTVMDISTFRTKLASFISDESWPSYIGTPTYTNKKIPGAYNVVINNQPLTSNNILANLSSNWDTCVGSNTDCQNVEDLFKKNYENYQAVCNVPSPNWSSLPTATKLPYIYGWVPFQCDGQMNALAFTPGANYTTAENSYQNLQYNYESPPPSPQIIFNPYTKFVHDAQYIGMNAYAFSIDDAVGNMNELGDGIVIAVGGSTGLPNGQAFDKDKVANVNLGAPTGPDPSWTSYGICKSTTNKELPSGALSFQLLTVDYPCEITLKDSNDRLYHFTLTGPPPFSGNEVQCSPGDTWCSGINIDTNTQHDVNTPPTVP